jgi:hypothetical protein
MPERFALYYAPAAGSPLAEAAETWFARPELTPLTVSARRYGFHATIKAPMVLRDGVGRPALETALAAFARTYRPVAIGRLRPTPIEGFIALTPVNQSPELTAFAADVVDAFEPFRAPLDRAETARRLAAPLTERQIALVERYGYPYVLDEFRFHMTLTDRLEPEPQRVLLSEAETWFRPTLAEPAVLDRLVLFRDPGHGGAFERLDDFRLKGQAG